MSMCTGRDRKRVVTGDGGRGGEVGGRGRGRHGLPRKVSSEAWDHPGLTLLVVGGKGEGGGCLWCLVQELNKNFLPWLQPEAIGT